MCAAVEQGAIQHKCMWAGGRVATPMAWGPWKERGELSGGTLPFRRLKESEDNWRQSHHAALSGNGVTCSSTSTFSHEGGEWGRWAGRSGRALLWGVSGQQEVNYSSTVLLFLALEEQAGSGCGRWCTQWPEGRYQGLHQKWQWQGHKGTERLSRPLVLLPGLQACAYQTNRIGVRALIYSGQNHTQGSSTRHLHVYQEQEGPWLLHLIWENLQNNYQW